MQEKKPKNGNVKNATETKRLEKEYKRLQLELSKERDNYAQMHKQFNQEIHALKEDLDKKEQDIFKFKSLLNNQSNANSSSSNQNNSNSIQTGLQLANGILTHPALHLHSLSASPINSSVNLSNYSLTNPFDDTLEHQDNQDRLETWLSIPNKRNIKKHGWKKLYVVLRKGKLFFYNSLRDNKESQEPYMTIDLDKVYHVRAVTQTDVVRAGTRDVAKIFQILYDVDAVHGPGSYTYLGATTTNEMLTSKSKINSTSNTTMNNTTLYTTVMENSPSMSNANLSTATLNNPDNYPDSAVGSSTLRSMNGLDEFSGRLSSDAISVGSNDSGDKHKDGKLSIKGHKFIDIKYRMPTYCDACNKPLWDLFNPPLALECLCKLIILKLYKIVYFLYFFWLNLKLIYLACHTKIHQEHYTNEKDSFQPCLCKCYFECFFSLYHIN